MIYSSNILFQEKNYKAGDIDDSDYIKKHIAAKQRYLNTAYLYYNN